VVRERRAVEVDQGLSVHLGRGGSALFLTLTVRHHRGDRLAERLEVVSESMRLLLKGSAWARRRDRLGFVGSIKAVEITHGDNGWHPHSHTALLFDRQLTDQEILDLHCWIFQRWSGICADHGFGEVHPVHGVDLRPITDGEGVGRYVTKVVEGWSAGHELTRGDRKSSSPLQLLRTFVETGETRFRDLWVEYETATYGKRSLRWSAGLRAHLLGDEEEATDVELAAGEGVDLTLIRALVDSERWNRITRAGATGHLLDEIEHVSALLLVLVDTCGGNPQPLDVPTPEPEHPPGGRRPPQAAEPPGRSKR
jgi:hypothetical protein